MGCAGLAALTVVGPGVPAGPIPDSPPVAAYTTPDTNANPTGRVNGAVRWVGPFPVAEPIYGLIQTERGSRWTHKPNPFLPWVNVDGLIEGVVVQLKNIDPKRAKPWTRGLVTVEVDDSAVVARQDGKVDAIAFTKLGEEVELVSRDKNFNAIRGRGAAFFTLPFPTPNQPIRRKLDRPGRVEFTSGAGFFWTAADVFVCEHPYYTLTDSKGHFVLDGVPPGTYEITAWLRPWVITGRDRDPETGRIVRLHFQEETVATGHVTVPQTGSVSIELTLPAKR